MPFRKHPTYVRKARNGYQLQRGVPKDVQPVIGKTVWVEGAGSTYRVAQRLSPVFAAKTDRLIAEASNEVWLTGDELIDSVPQRFDLSDPDMVQLLLDMTLGYTHPEMNKAVERHQSMCTKYLFKCLAL